MFLASARENRVTTVRTRDDDFPFSDPARAIRESFRNPLSRSLSDQHLIWH